MVSDVKKILRIERALDFKTPFNRPNLHYSVRLKSENVLDDMVDLIREKYNKASGIVYCFSKKEVEAVAEHLSQNGIIHFPHSFHGVCWDFDEFCFV